MNTTIEPQKTKYNIIKKIINIIINIICFILNLILAFYIFIAVLGIIWFRDMSAVSHHLNVIVMSIYYYIFGV